MATGWAGDGAVQDQIDATVKDGIARARSRLRQGPGLERCEECDAAIPEALASAMAQSGSGDSQIDGGLLFRHTPDQFVVRHSRSS